MIAAFSLAGVAVSDGGVLIVDFRSLAIATYPVHLGNKSMIDRLYDVWISFGGFTPDSFNFNEKGLRAAIDVRRDQRREGILLKRIVPRPQFEQWWIDCCKIHSIGAATEETAKIAYFSLCNDLNYVDERIKRGNQS